ncbi:MAG: hypothetical protein ABFS21_00520 [Actinomycetota bacterium]
MNERDHELIVDLIDGRLSPQEERAALARVETDAELRSEYEAQRAMSSLLADAPVPTMTSDERTRLHAALKQELHLEPVVAPVPARSSRWQRWLAPIGSLAAAAAVLAGVFFVLPQSSNDSATVALDATTVAASAETTAAPDVADGGEAETNTLAEAPAAAGMDTQAEESRESAPASDEQLPETFNAALSFPHLPDITLEEIAAARLAAPKATLSGEAGSGDDAANNPLTADCLAVLRANTAFASVEPVATTTIEASDALVVEVTTTNGDLYHAAYAIDTCSELQNTKP